MSKPKSERPYAVTLAVSAGRKRRHDEYVEALRNGTYTRSSTVPSGKVYRRKSRSNRHEA